MVKFKIEKIIRFTSVLIISFLLSFVLMGGGKPPKPDVRISKLDFVSNDGNYVVNWPGPPRRTLTYSDVEHFTPQIELDTPSPKDMVLGFWVKANRAFWPDPTLGCFVVTFKKGETTLSFYEIRTPNVGPGVTPPAGAPDITYGSFWLGCTKEGKLRGNEGKDNDGHANVYLEKFTEIGPAGVVVGGKEKSGQRTIERY